MIRKWKTETSGDDLKRSLLTFQQMNIDNSSLVLEDRDSYFETAKTLVRLIRPWGNHHVPKKVIQIVFVNFLSTLILNVSVSNHKQAFFNVGMVTSQTSWRHVAEFITQLK